MNQKEARFGRSGQLWEAYDKAREACDKAGAVYIEAGEAYDKALKAYDEAYIKVREDEA